MEEQKKQEMESLFVPYTEALTLKELGFDESCIGYFHGGNPIKFSFTDKIKNSKCLARVKRDNKKGHTVYLCTRPTYSQAFRWFREKHNLYFNIHRLPHRIGTNKEFMLTIDAEEFSGGYYKTYEEAELACLRKLIEIVKANS